MIDKAASETEKRLKKIEKELKKIYKQSQDDVTKAWKAYMSTQDAYVKDLQEAYATAKQFGTAEEAREIGRQLGIAKAERTLQNQYYKDMVKETARKISEVNQIALAYVNNQMPWVYATNFNEAAKTMDKVGFRFDMVDESTVRRRVLDGDIKLPRKKINDPKDMQWNTKQLNSSVLQGIVNGEPLNKIADRIMPIVNNNAASAIRNARTMMTGAQNEGRQDSFERMDDMGVVVHKVWIATPDERTRESHFELDGEEVPYDEPFSNGLMYPGDPSGAPEEVYNCRCTMRSQVVGFRKADGRIEPVDLPEHEGLHQQQMEEERERREQTEEVFEEQASRNPDDYAEWSEDDNRQAYEDMDKVEDEERLIYDNYVGTSNSWSINSKLRNDILLNGSDAETVEALSNTINRNVMKGNVKGVRFVDSSYMDNVFGIDAMDFDRLMKNFDKNKDVFEGFVGTTIKEKGFMSTSTNVKRNVFTSRPVRMDILIPKGTNVYVTRNYYESEIIFNKGTEYEIIGFKEEAGRWGNKTLIMQVIMK